MSRAVRARRLPSRCRRCRRLTRRLREQAGAEAAERGITPAEAARHAEVSWPAAHAAFAAMADPVLEPAPAPVAHLGIDEHRRGRPRWERDADTGEYGGGPATEPKRTLSRFGEGQVGSPRDGLRGSLACDLVRSQPVVILAGAGIAW